MNAISQLLFPLIAMKTIENSPKNSKRLIFTQPIQIFTRIGFFHQIEDFQMERKPPQKQNSYKFSQIFGYKGIGDKLQDEDVITCLKFDNEGKMIALGDRAGRVIIFDRSKGEQKGNGSFQYCTEFQAHEHQFDPLRSSEIEESLVDINWLNRQGKYRKLITANSHNIRLWKIYEKTQKKFLKSTTGELSIPRLQNDKVSTTATLQRSFPVKHGSHIKQTSPSNNQQFLLSTDDSQIFLWDIERADQPYLVCDMGAVLRVEDCQEINCCQMHPQQDSIFLYGMSKGSLKMGDLRISSKVQANSLCYKSSSSSNNKQRNLLLDAVSSISSASFTNNGKYLVSRDCLSVKIWDIAIPNKPVSTVFIHQGIKSKLGEMVDNESIYDSFKVRVSNDGGTILTGTYNNCFHLIDAQSSMNSQYELNYRKSTICRSIDQKSAPLTKMDYARRTLVSDFSPVDDTLAVASLNCFFTYSL